MEPQPVPSDRISIRRKAFEAIKRLSFKRGDFTLSSGAKSDYFLDLKRTMLDPVGIRLLAELVLQRIDGLGVEYIGGLEMGAVPLISPINLLSGDQGRGIPGFFVRKQVKLHGTMKQVEAPEGDLAGKRVVVLDDVTTSGASALKAVKAVQAEGANVVLVLAVVDRESGAAKLFERENIPFTALFRASEFFATA